MKKWIIPIVCLLAIGALFYFKRFLTVDAIIRFIIKYNEGGFQNDPNDKGNYVNGKLVGTKYGIAAKYHPKEDIPNMSIGRAVEIFRNEYYSKLPPITNLNLLYQVLDMAINAGVTNALKMYRPNMTADEYRKKRIEYYTSLPQFSLYQKSWLRRANIDYLKDKNKV